MNNPSEYTIDEHTHRFGLWTAARAASKSLLSNCEVEDIIAGIGLKKKVEALRLDNNLSEEDYKSWLYTNCTLLKEAVKASNCKDLKKDRIEYGIAAKIISIYIKTVEVIPTGGLSRLSEIAYPPIDSILLKNINEHLTPKLEDTRWSLFSWDQYIDTINKIKHLVANEPMWKLEVYWLNKKKWKHGIIEKQL